MSVEEVLRKVDLEDQEELDILKPRIVTLTKHSKVSGNSQLTENYEDISSTEITTFDSLNQVESPSYLTMFFQQINFEVIQILRTPLYLLGIFIVPFLIPFLLRLSGNTDDQILPLTAICGLFLFTIVIDRFLVTKKVGITHPTIIVT
ncbi:hypothetical protein [Geminocystis sp. GBBB08]|uniref:hypothetical protein n=1 Tax=Geminocystis sp. GBBB08 TaxID=2604140 RepID=UPI0027E294E4|nr:hypothetical protein [Geminocystis sp. GBBB08]MBL1208541.1 hypothetical protein [Geminocystis sp. GBBB08]